MRKEIRDIISTMNVYEKQELIMILTKEIYDNHNKMLNDLNNIDGHVFGMILNADNNALNGLTVTQLGRIKNITSNK